MKTDVFQNNPKSHNTFGLFLKALDLQKSPNQVTLFAANVHFKVQLKEKSSRARVKNFVSNSGSIFRDIVSQLWQIYDSRKVIHSIRASFILIGRAGSVVETGEAVSQNGNGQDSNWRITAILLTRKIENKSTWVFRVHFEYMNLSQYLMYVPISVPIVPNVCIYCT